ncbi:MAG: glutamate dehydrogenase [Solirubrobacteraceae bacterium]|nr:glutamate dehydrogenase [Solirubrobacteraceae bacterium]
MTLAEESLRGRVAALAANGLEQAFARAYLHRLRGDGTPEEQILRELQGAFALLAGRGRRPAAVRAFTPTLETDGYEAPGSVVETATDDLPYLVDSVTAELQARGLVVRRVVHPILGTERSTEGALEAITEPKDSARRESVMHFELDRTLPADSLAEVEAELLVILGDVRRVVADFPAMTQCVNRMVERARAGAGAYPFDEVNESIAFLRWLLDGTFTFLGYREYEVVDDTLSVVPGTGLGLLNDIASSTVADGVPVAEMRASTQRWIREGDLLTVAKTNALSPVRRRARMDYIGVRFEEGGKVGECRLVGLFTRKAYAMPAADTPLLGHKLRRILEAEGLIAGSHDSRATIAIFGSFFKDELLTASWEDLRATIVDLLDLESDQVRVLDRATHDERTATLVVALPRQSYSARLGERIQHLLQTRYGAESTVESHLVIDDQFTHARLHFSIHARSGDLPEPDVEALQRDIASLTRSWDDAVEDALREQCGSARARELVSTWAPQFPDFYKTATEAYLGAADIERLDAMAASEEELVVGLQPADGRSGPRTRLTLYKRGGKVQLTEILPTLEMLGLRVSDERPVRLEGGDGETFAQSFGVLAPDGQPLDLEAIGDRLADTIVAVRRGDTEADWLSKLVLVAGLTWQQVGMLRAYRVYRQRAGARFGLRYDGEAFAAQHEIATKLVGYFELRHGPDADTAAADALRQELLTDLDAVESLDQDRILRDQLTLLDATLRTNAFKPGRDAMSIKLRSGDIPGIPAPKPHVEVFVHSVAMEGIHLRGGAIARGGLRWSDRLDFRTEVYGLMRAQMVKNAVIVPAGAKGGFYLKKRPENLREAVAEQYRRYIRSLLDITDNLVDGALVHPEGVRVLDGEDPYLVVAADKGTATFSDTANAIAEDYGFWLGDAFASGGSEGYDHKGLGITARGAWESVKRHFRELSIDPERDEITAVGIGDMSGDVFGNGMLLSQTLKLVGAYDHRHVYLDPNPADAARSHLERQRLFDLAGSSWDDYDRELISAGGGVWPRTAKSIPISEEARSALGIADETLTPDEVIRAILRAPVDLLFNGGIGTVIKASTESDADAQDRASDNIRVDACDLRCRVIGEGGNLGLTQHARIEFASAGGRVNADFIDNSAGVDCSDHEVNLKILVGMGVARGELTIEERHAVLRAATQDVVEHVLGDSYRQARILSRELGVCSMRLFAYEDLMTDLEEEGLLDRKADGLPTVQQIGQRRRGGQGLYRPELSVLLAHAKRSLTEALLGCTLLDDPWFERDLRGYFPPVMVERFGHLLGEHRLRRELLATLVANEVVDALGPTFVSRLATELGTSAEDVVRAYRIARDVTGSVGRFAAIDALDASLDRALETELIDGVEKLIEAVTRWYLTHPPEGSLTEIIERDFEGLDAIEDALESSPPEHTLAERERLEAAGVPPTLAEAHALGVAIAVAPDVIAVAGQVDRPLRDGAQTFWLVNDRLRFTWLDAELEALTANQRVQRWAVQALRDDARSARREVVAAALAASPGADPEAAVEAFVQAEAAGTAHLAAIVRSLSVDGSDLAGLMVIVRELRALAA